MWSKYHYIFWRIAHIWEQILTSIKWISDVVFVKFILLREWKRNLWSCNMEKLVMLKIYIPFAWIFEISRPRGYGNYFTWTDTFNDCFVCPTSFVISNENLRVKITTVQNLCERIKYSTIQMSNTTSTLKFYKDISSTSIT